MNKEKRELKESIRNYYEKLLIRVQSTSKDNDEFINTASDMITEKTMEIFETAEKICRE